jgi:hypothetical protein
VRFLRALFSCSAIKSLSLRLRVTGDERVFSFPLGGIWARRWRRGVVSDSSAVVVAILLESSLSTRRRNAVGSTCSFSSITISSS